MASLFHFVNRFAAHPRWCALLLGILSALGFEPLHLWALTLLALAGLIAITARAANMRQAWTIGWLFGLGHFSLGNSWIATAFTYQANMPAWLGWFAVVALAVYLAVYPGLAVLAAWRIGRGLSSLTLAFAGCWIMTEWLRSWVFSGFVWNPLGMVLLGPFEHAGTARLVPWLGTYALSGLAVLMAGLLLAALAPAARSKHRLAALGGLSLLVLPMIVALPAGKPRQGTVPFSLIQPDIRQEVLNDPAEYENNFMQTVRPTLQRPPGERLILWPESGVQDYLRDGYPPWLYWDTTYGEDPGLARGRLARVAGPGGLLLTGAMDLQLDGRTIEGATNVVTAIDGRGILRGSYAKAHLVPYGEYLPMRAILEPLGAARLVPGGFDFLHGPGPRSLDFGRLGKAGVQICYEIIFSGRVVDPALRPDYIFNPSNDGWFGSAGPPQHLAQARMRAIEEGLPVLRATTTGISAVIDARGVVRQHVPSHRIGRLDGLVPPALPPTLFARLGNALPLGWALLLIALSLVATRRLRS